MFGNASGRLGEAWGGLGKALGDASGRRPNANWELTEKNIGKCGQNNHFNGSVMMSTRSPARARARARRKTLENAGKTTTSTVL